MPVSDLQTLPTLDLQTLPTLPLYLYMRSMPSPMRVGSALLALGCLLSAEPAAAYVPPHPSLHLRHARTQLSTNAWGKHRSIGSGRRRCGIEAHSSDTVEDLRARVGDDRGTEDMSASAQAFGQWYRDAGASTVLKLSHFGGTGMRGLMATRPIEAGDELLSYPRAVTMDMSRLTDCPCADFVDAQYWKSCLWFVQVLHSCVRRAGHACSLARKRSPWPTHTCHTHTLFACISPHTAMQ